MNESKPQCQNNKTNTPTVHSIYLVARHLPTQEKILLIKYLVDAIADETTDTEEKSIL